MDERADNGELPGTARTARTHTGELSFQEIDYPDRDVSLRHEFSLDSALVDSHGLDATFDCALYVADVDQTWKRAWPYDPVTAGAGTPEPRTAPADD